MFHMRRTPTNSAKYLVLCGKPDAQRALLFNGDHQYLTEMIDDDGIVLDRLLRAGKVCHSPNANLLQAISQQAANSSVRCFALE
jgi:hypothetical protein